MSRPAWCWAVGVLLLGAGLAAPAGAETLPLGRGLGSGSGAADQLFGRRGGYVHPFIGVTEWYADNVFNSAHDAQHEFTTLVSPGIWLALPASDVRMLDVQTLNVAPGGLAVSRFAVPSTQRYQTYLLYEANYEYLARFSEKRQLYHRLEGLAQYNLRKGISVDISDQFLNTREPWSTWLSVQRDEYSSNLFDATISYDTGNRLQIGAGYSNYRIRYQAERNAARDRRDHGYLARVAYRLEAKTTLFTQYRHIRIGYDDSAISESRENQVHGGLQWNLTAKSRGRLSVGYGWKDNDDSDDERDLLFEIQADHAFTPKTSLRLVGARRQNETTIAGTDGILSNSIFSQLAYNLTTRIGVLANGSYTRDRYRGDLTVGTKTTEREDHVYSLGVSLEYEPRPWARLALGYEYAARQSNFEGFDYQKNTIFLTGRVGI